MRTRVLTVIGGLGAALVIVVWLVATSAAVAPSTFLIVYSLCAGALILASVALCARLLAGNPGATPAGASPTATDPVANDARALRLLANQQKALLNNLSDMAWLKDAESRFVAVNEAFARACGRAPEQLVGKTDLDIWPRELAECYRRADRDVVSTRRRFQVVEPLIDADGAERWIETIKTPVFGEADEVVGTVGLARDITERRRAEAERDALHRQLVAASRQAGMAEVAIDMLGNVQSALESMNVSAGLAAQRLRDVNVSGLAKAGAMLAKHIDRAGAFFGPDEHGQKLPGYLSDLGHHLEAEQKAVVEAMMNMTGELERLKEMVAVQQAYAHFSGAVESVPLSEVVDDALRISNAAFEKEGISVVRDYTPLPPMRIDRQKLIQILINLISNARQALKDCVRTDKRLTLRIANAKEPDRVLVQVIDNGAGISKENLPRVFIHGFTTRNDGHGFGLPHAAEAAHEMGGSIAAASDGLDCGAVFTLELPIRS